MDKATFYLATGSSSLGRNRSSLRSSILRGYLIRYNILCLACRYYNLVSSFNLEGARLFASSLHLPKWLYFYLLLFHLEIIINLLLAIYIFSAIDHANELIHLGILNLQLHKALSNISNLLLSIPNPISHSIELREEFNHGD